MAKNKLFALEELETGADAVELEASPEAGEVADVQVEVEQELGEVTESSDSIEEGMGAADQLEEVEEVVADAVEQGEGLDPVAAEAIRIAVEAICSRVGANPKSVYALYATENFQSASSRKANSKIALEGVGEFLKDLWKKIKAALTRLWAKAKEFFAKHFSSLGRVKKALDSLKTKISESSGKIKDKAYVEEAPAYLADAFPGKGDLSEATVAAYIKNHVAAENAVESIAKFGADVNAAVIASIKAGKAENFNKFSGSYELGTSSAPLVGGSFVKFKAKVEDGDLSVEVEHETTEKNPKVGFSVTDKAKLASLVKEVSDVIAADLKKKASFDKEEAAFSKTMVDLEKQLNDTVKDEATSEAAKEIRKGIKAVYKINSKTPSIAAEKVSADIKLAKAVIGFCSFTMKQYK